MDSTSLPVFWRSLLLKSTQPTPFHSSALKSNTIPDYMPLHPRREPQIFHGTYNFLPWSTTPSDTSHICYGAAGTCVVWIKCITIVGRQEWSNTWETTTVIMLRYTCNRMAWIICRSFNLLCTDNGLCLPIWYLKGRDWNLQNYDFIHSSVRVCNIISDINRIHWGCLRTGADKYIWIQKNGENNSFWLLHSQVILIIQGSSPPPQGNTSSHVFVNVP
jgi:hypothetical protein